MHIVLLQESEKDMSVRLIIDGNAVYEIDEDCEARNQKRISASNRMWKQEDKKQRRRQGENDTE